MTAVPDISYLRRFPINKIKNDRSFLADVTRHKTAASFVTAIIGLPESLNLKVHADGVETRGDQLIGWHRPLFQPCYRRGSTPFMSRLRPLQVLKPGGMASLSNREREVLDLVVEGMKNEEIADKLAITEHTVRKLRLSYFRQTWCFEPR